MIIDKSKINTLLRIRIDRFEDSVSTLRLSELVAHLCPMLDCDVWTVDDQDMPTLAHKADWLREDGIEWLKPICFAQKRVQEGVEEYLQKCANLLEVITDESGNVIGRASIGFGRVEGGVEAIDGLISGGNSRNINSFSEEYIGVINAKVDGPSRVRGSIDYAKEALAKWAGQQSKKLVNQGLNPSEQYLAAINVAGFGGDATPIAHLLLNRKLVPIVEIASKLLSKCALYAPIRIDFNDNSKPSIGSVLLRISPWEQQGLTPEEITFECDTIEAWRLGRHKDLYHRLRHDDAESPSNVVELLRRIIERSGRKLASERIVDHQFGTYQGESSEGHSITRGLKLIGQALRLSCEPT